MKNIYLIILDGFGLGNDDKGDAISKANKPFLSKIFDQYPLAKLKTDGKAVGLPSFQTGGSEVGHITIGSGRVVKQLLTKINDQIESGEFFENEVLVDLFKKAKKKGRIHLLGLCSDGGIHSFLSHLFGLQKMAIQYNIPDVFIHAFLDGRDVEERSAKAYLQQIEGQKIGRIASLGGRFFGMDRDKNWDRVVQHYRVFCDPKVKASGSTWNDILDYFYKTSDKSDYYVPPRLLVKEGQFQSDDVLIFFNFRTDRARQIATSLFADKFEHFPRPFHMNPDNFGAFGDYFNKAKKPFTFGKESIPNTLGEIVSNFGGTQLRITETEKFNHVTFFFSGEQKEEFPGEKRVLIPSPKCPSYAEKPEMSAREQTDRALKEISKHDYNLVVQNYANSDLVGHSGKLKPTIEAIEVLDECLARLIPEAQKKGYDIILTADHGNSDGMFYPNGEESASHTKNPVPFVLISDKKMNIK